MGKEIVKIIAKEKDSINAAFVIANSIQKLKQELMIEFAKTLKVKFTALQTGNVIDYDEPNIGKKDSSFDFYTDKTAGYYVSLYFIGDFGDIIIGIGHDKVNNSRVDSFKKEIKDYFKQELANLRKGKVENVETAWFLWAWITRYDSVTNFFSTSEGWSSIPSNDISIIDDIIETVSFLLNKIENAVVLFPELTKS